MEMPFHLRTLPPEALDIIRFYSGSGTNVASVDDICEGTGLSDRGFGKAIRRLVTKGYVIMDGDHRYRLSDQGARAVEELVASDVNAPDDDEAEAVDAGRRLVGRRLFMALPRALVAGQEVHVYVGFPEAEDDEMIHGQVNLLIRLSVLNGEPARARETPFLLGNNATRHVFEVTAGHFTKARLRLHAYQIDDDEPDEVHFAGGMYVDVDVKPDSSGGLAYTTYATDAEFVVYE
jgi:hypothetical protein